MRALGRRVSRKLPLASMTKPRGAAISKPDHAAPIWDEDGNSAMVISTGWGDGVYPVIAESRGSYLMRVHIDFTQYYPEDTGYPSQQRSRPS